MHFLSVALIATVLATSVSMAAAFSFSPALFSLRPPGGALRTASETCLARSPAGLRGAASGGLAALSMTGTEDRMSVVHLLKTLTRAVELEEKNSQVDNIVVEQKEEIAGLQGENERQNAAISVLQQLVEQQNRTITGLLGRADALTHVFAWSVPSSWSDKSSAVFTFADGVRGHASTGTPENENYTHWMGFTLDQGPICKHKCKCSILDKNDKILRVVSPESWSDFQRPSTSTRPVGGGGGAAFNLTDADIAGATRSDGTIKLRMVVHLFLPE